MRLVERTKECTRCHVVKPWSEFHAKTRWDDGTKRTVQARCIPCQRDSRRENRRRQRSDPAERERLNAKQREWRRTYYANPENRAAVQAYEREWHRQRYGYRPRPRVVNIGAVPRMPAEPFAAWLRTLEPRYETRQVLADALGINEATVRRTLEGKPTVELDTVDRALLNIGGATTLNDLYPLEEAA